MGRSQYLEHQGIQIANGNVVNTYHIHKFGANPDVDASYEIIWEVGGASITYPTTAAVASINSASGNSGSEITIQGLDENFLEVSDTITLNGSGDGSTTQTFLRINRAFTSNDNAISSDVTITVGGNTLAKIDADHQQTLQCVYTVPADKKAFLTQLNGGVSEKEKNVEMRFYAKEHNGPGVFRTRDFIAFQTSTFEKNYPVPLMFNSKTDIQLQAKCAGNAIISGSFDLILVKK